MFFGGEGNVVGDVWTCLDPGFVRCCLVYPPENYHSSLKNGWLELEDDPFLVEWIIFRGELLNFWRVLL